MRRTRTRARTGPSDGEVDEVQPVHKPAGQKAASERVRGRTKLSRNGALQMRQAHEPVNARLRGHSPVHVS